MSELSFAAPKLRSNLHEHGDKLTVVIGKTFNNLMKENHDLREQVVALESRILIPLIYTQKRCKYAT
jgi:hypothetical protein